MRELSERSHADDGSSDALVERCKAHFKQMSQMYETTESKQSQLEQLKQHMPEDAQLDNSTVEALGGMLLVETLALQSGRRENNFMHVNMYLDDRGTLKGLPRNPRATEIARLAGVETDIHGDAFIGRTVDDGDCFERHSFSLAECSSSAKWFEEARASNARREKHSSGLSEFASNSGTKMINMSSGSSGDPSAAEESAPVQDSSGTFTWSQDSEEVFIDINCPPETKACAQRTKIAINSVKESAHIFHWTSSSMPSVRRART
jgi:hypothetical protein